MEFRDNYCYELHTDMNGLEQVLKSAYLSSRDFPFQLPHSLSEVTPVLRRVGLKCSQSMTDLLLHSDLEEKNFFSDDMDTAIFRHIRYLPAYWHSHKFLEVICVMEGTCTNYIGSQTLSMHPGDICILSPDTVHAISAFSDDCVIFNLLLRTSTFETAFFGTLSGHDILSDFFIRALYHTPAHPYLLFCTGTDNELHNLIGYIYREYAENHQYKNRMLNTLVTGFFIILLRKYGGTVSVPSLGLHNADQNLIYMLEYMQEHYTTITMKELADFFNYSERHLNRLIQKSTGMTFSQNILKLKMRQAKRLLGKPEMSIAGIAEELGYSDASNFRAVFKKYFGCTPQEYRKNMEL